MTSADPAEVEPSQPTGSREPIVGEVIEGKRVALPDGTVLDLSGRHPPPSASPVYVQFIDVIAPMNFDICPICLHDAPATREHVPPESLGGRRATLTCADCNNGFGSFEAELLLHTRDAVRGPAFTADGVPGRRRASEIAISFQEDGSAAFVVQQPDKAVMEMLRAGRLDMTYSLPRRAMWRTALVKHAYLAACLYLQEVPDTRHGHFLRVELLEACDRGTSHEMGVFATALRMMRGYDNVPAPLFLATASEAEQAMAFVGLGRHWTVAWPMPDTAAMLATRITANQRSSST